MSDVLFQGIMDGADVANQVRNDISVIAINWYSNRCPLVTRVRRVPVGSTTFSMNNRTYRPRSGTLGAAISSTSATSITFADASPYMLGDVLELASGERVQLASDPNVGANTATVVRGVEGTTAATQANGSAVLLISNARPDGSVNQNAVTFIPQSVLQYCQTWMQPVQVAGTVQASTAFVTEPGVTTPFAQYKMDALQNMMDDMEVSSYYGWGRAQSSGSATIQKGLRAQIAPANLVLSGSPPSGYVGTPASTSGPTNAGAYKPTDLIRDTFQQARLGGGDPDTLLVSTNFMGGLATWGTVAQRIDAGTTIFGIAIKTFMVPFLPNVTIIEAPLMRGYTACALTSAEVVMRMKRNEFWNPHGVRGDAVEGDWIAEGAIELDNPAHHAWVEGITAFSAT